MTLKKVYIEMDQNWEWWVSGVTGPASGTSELRPKTVTVNEAWLEELKVITKQYNDMRQVLELLYRQQEGITQYTLNDEEKVRLIKATTE